MHRELETAFRNAHYRVLDAAGDFVLQIDQPSAKLQQLLHGLREVEASLLTAFNPGARPRDLESNQRAQRELVAELTSEGFRVITAQNEDPENRWPLEASVLVPGLSLSRARRAAERHGQVAFLWSDGSGTPRLVETAPGRLPDH
jgi:hypothetical protein